MMEHDESLENKALFECLLISRCLPPERTALFVPPKWTGAGRDLNMTYVVVILIAILCFFKQAT